MKSLLLILLLLQGVILDESIEPLEPNPTAIPQIDGLDSFRYVECTGILKITCPKGYDQIYKGEGIMKKCWCKRPATREEMEEAIKPYCEGQYSECAAGNQYACRLISPHYCPLPIFIRACDNNVGDFDEEFCYKKRIEYADYKNREGLTDDQLEKCQNYKKYCADGNNFFCKNVLDNCDKRTIKELCDKKVIKNDATCAIVKRQIEEFEPKEEDKPTTVSATVPTKAAETPVEDPNKALCEKSIEGCKSKLRMNDCYNIYAYCGKEITAELCLEGVINDTSLCIKAQQRGK